MMQLYCLPLYTTIIDFYSYINALSLHLQEIFVLLVNILNVIVLLISSRIEMNRSV